MKIADVGIRFGMGVSNIFDPWNPTVFVPEKVSDLAAKIKEIDLVCLGGGADIHPAMYGHKNVASYSGSKSPSFRDLFEGLVFDLCQEHNKPILGICRGAQMVCVKSGGWLIQDIAGHTSSGFHILKTDEDKEVEMTSFHHQMMYPWDVKHKIIAWTPKNKTAYHWDTSSAKMNEFTKEPEIVYFPETHSLAIQGHPEFYSDPSQAPVVYTRELVEKYLLKKGA